jgi:hypothetical protein
MQLVEDGKINLHADINTYQSGSEFLASVVAPLRMEPRPMDLFGALPSRVPRPTNKRERAAELTGPLPRFKEVS